MTRRKSLPIKGPSLCFVLPIVLGVLPSLGAGCGPDETVVEYVGAHSFIFNVNEPMVGPVPSASAFRGSVVVRRAGEGRVSIGVSPTCTLKGTLADGAVELSDGAVTCAYRLNFIPARCWLSSAMGEMTVTFTAPVTLSLTKQGEVSVRATVEIPAEQDYLCKGRLSRSSYLFDGEESAL